MTFEKFKEQVCMEKARMFPKSVCQIDMEQNENGSAVNIACIGNLDAPSAVFRIDLPDGVQDDLPEKMEMNILSESPKMKLRKVSGSATKILRMLHRNFEIMNNIQAAM